MSEFANIRHALEIARQNGFAEVEVETDGVRFFGALEAVAPIKAQAVVGGESSLPFPTMAEIAATSVGYFRTAGSAVGVGDRIDKGQIAAVIEALGIQNEVESKCAGEVVEVLARDGDAVEFGQVLFRVKESQ